MTTQPATAIAHPNIAFIKYWGNRDNALNLPASGSLSMNLGALTTRTTVRFDPDLRADSLILNGVQAEPTARQRVTNFLDRARALAGTIDHAEVVSENDFPTGAGIASSAAAFAALGLAAAAALGLELDEASLSRLARRGSGSACRSVPAGFVEWLPGDSDTSSFARTIAPPGHWDLVDCVAILQSGHKPVGSTTGHRLAHTSPFQSARLQGAPRRLDICRQAILDRDFKTFAAVVEQDSNLMHAVMTTSTPPLFYWEPASLELMKTIPVWRAKGLPVCYTLDAGPNVHVLCLSADVPEVKKRLEQFPHVQRVIVSPPGGAARLVTE